MRVGIVAIQHESNTFLASPTTLADFERDLLLRGEELRRLEASHHEVGGFFAGLADAGINAVPIVAIRAIPSGTITADTFAHLLDILHSELDRAGPLDGLLVAPHGAMVSEAEPDADGFWLSGLRRRFGSEFPIMGTLDPHGNLSQRMIDATDALIAYRTNPHLDQRQRGIEAAMLLARTLRRDVAPTQAAAFPPLVINIERQRTNEPPCLLQYHFADEMLRRPGVLANSLMLGFPYSDVPEMGSAVIVVTDNDRDLAHRFAREWSDRLWSHRHEFVGQLIDIPEALDRTAALPGPVCLLDMGDNVGGGSPGDGTLIAKALHQRGFGPAFVCMFDPESVQQAETAGIGARIPLRVGGKSDDLHGLPLEADFTVLGLFDGRFDEPQSRHGGFLSFDQGRTAVVRTASGLTVMLTSRRVPPFSLRQLTAFGIDPGKFRAIVVKGVHAPIAAYAPVCNYLIRVNTPGVTTADLSRLEYRQRRRPLFPFESI